MTFQKCNPIRFDTATFNSEDNREFPHSPSHYRMSNFLTNLIQGSGFKGETCSEPGGSTFVVCTPWQSYHHTIQDSLSPSTTLLPSWLRTTYLMDGPLIVEMSFCNIPETIILTFPAAFHLDEDYVWVLGLEMQLEAKGLSCPHNTLRGFD